jgi:hypothetical protein
MQEIFSSNIALQIFLLVYVLSEIVLKMGRCENPEYHGIWRNITEYHDIFPEYTGTSRYFSIAMRLFINMSRKFTCQGGNVGHYSINELISDEIINSISCKIRKYLASSVTIIRIIPCKGTVL